MKKVTYWEAWHSEISRLINEHCGLPYQYDVLVAEGYNKVTPDCECGCKCDKTVHFTVIAEMTPLRKNDYAKMLSGDKIKYKTQVLLCFLATKGIIKSGDYYILMK